MLGTACGVTGCFQSFVVDAVVLQRMFSVLFFGTEMQGRQLMCDNKGNTQVALPHNTEPLSARQCKISSSGVVP